MPSLTIDKLKQALRGGVRNNLFQVTIIPVGVNVPAVPGGDLGENLSILIRAGQIPASTVGSIEVPFRGLRYKVPGDRTFDPWTMTVYNDPNMQFRGFFEQWSNNMKGLASNTGQLDPTTLYGAIEVRQLNNQGEIIGQPWTLQSCWPSDVSAIDLSADNENTVSDFTVTWQYQYWTHQPYTDGPNADTVTSGIS